MIFEISFSIFNFFSSFFYFHFFKWVIFAYFCFLAKTPPNCKSYFKKKRSKSWICTIIFHISLKKSIFWRWPFFSDLWHGIALYSFQYTNHLIDTIHVKAFIKQIILKVEVSNLNWQTKVIKKLSEKYENNLFFLCFVLSWYKWHSAFVVYYVFKSRRGKRKLLLSFLKLIWSSLITNMLLSSKNIQNFGSIKRNIYTYKMPTLTTFVFCISYVLYLLCLWWLWYFLCSICCGIRYFVIVLRW